MTKRSLVAVALCASLLAVAPLAEAKRPRREQTRYSLTDDNNAVLVGPLLVGQNAAGAAYQFALRRTERRVAVRLVDDSEEPVGGVIRQYVTVSEGEAGPATWERRRAVTSIEFCGSTGGPVRVRKKLEITILVVEGFCPDGTPSLPTDGDIVVDFYPGR